MLSRNESGGRNTYLLEVVLPLTGLGRVGGAVFQELTILVTNLGLLEPVGGRGVSFLHKI